MAAASSRQPIELRPAFAQAFRRGKLEVAAKDQQPEGVTSGLHSQNMSEISPIGLDAGGEMSNILATFDFGGQQQN